MRLFDETHHRIFAVGRMVGEGAGADHGAANLAQGCEEFFRAADAGEGQHTTVPQPRGILRIGHEFGIENRQFTEGGQSGGAGTDNHHRIAAGQADVHRFAQRSRWQQPAIAEAIAAIDHQQRHGAFQAPGLVRVIRDHAGGTGRCRGAGTGDTVARDPGWRGFSQQQCFVAGLVDGMAQRIDAYRADEAAAISAGEHMRGVAEMAQVAGQRDGHRCLAGTAGNKVADRDHRYAGILRRGEHAVEVAGKAVDHSQRRQQDRPRRPAAGSPEIRCPRHRMTAALPARPVFGRRAGRLRRRDR